MKKLTATLALSLFIAAPTLAQPPAPTFSAEESQKLAQSLGECMAAKVSAEDKPILAQWVGAEIAAAPLMAGIATVDAAKRADLDKAAKVFTRLVTTDCVDLAKPLLKGDSATAFRTSGATIGRIAIRELMASPGVNAGLVRSYLTNLNQDDFRALMK
jgi:hypothetical protein